MLQHTQIPIQHTQSGVSQFYVADGWLAVWDSTANGGKRDSLLKDAMEQITGRGTQAK